ncbi:UBB [Symbiodinium natans]|uniref:UBB protein n=1 Tax=Symbiodinium natans TaxID=878477 RepID=A0A812VDX8_9DINO|nr:UBB [Symbiodinium natans]
MQIYLQTMAGKVILVSVEPSETIKSAKAKVQEAEGFIASQRWICCGQELLDRLTFEDHDIQAESTIDMVLSPKKIRISIRTLTGGLLNIQTEEQASVESLKAQIEEAAPGCFEGVAPEYRAWVFKGRSLEDGRNLSDYSIESGSTIWLAVRKNARRLPEELPAEPD